MVKINVGIYGGKSIFGGKEVRRRAEIVYCDKCEVCSLYQKNQCLNVTAPFGKCCKYGKVVVENGFTSKARKYGELERKYEKDPVRGVLTYPHSCKIAKIGDEIYLKMPHAHFKEGGVVSNEAFLSNNTYWMCPSDFNVDFIKQLCSLQPQALMGGTIRSYQEKEVPDFLLQLNAFLPSLYKDFVSKYPEYNKPFNYVGKMAYIHSLRDGTVLKVKNAEFVIKGDKLVCDNYKILFSPFNAGQWYIETKITNDMVVEIISNDQVDHKTIFKD